MELTEIIKQIEDQEEKKAEIAEEIKFIYQQAKKEGWNDKAIKRVVQSRKKPETQVEEEDQDYLKYKKELEGNG